VEFKVALQKARQAKGLTQKQLATLINERQSTVTDYESGKAIPNPAVIVKLNRALGVTLPKIPKKKKKADAEE
jgi:putative transcription factor